MLVISLVAAVSSWWMFMRLEAIDGRGRDLHLPSWLRWPAARGIAAPAFASRQPLWLLAKKEFRLQQLTLAVAGLYLIGWFSISSLTQLDPEFRTSLLFALTFFLAGAIPLLAGSLASAEERQLGTLEWQVLLPMAAWKQWAVKAAVAVGVAVVLSLGVPALLAWLSPEMRTEFSSSFVVHSTYFRPLQATVVGGVVILATVASLYVSSFCTTGLKALLVSLPAVLVVMAFVVGAVGLIPGGDLVFRGDLIFRPARFQQFFGTQERLLLMLLTGLPIVIYAGVIGLLLRFSLSNHRSAERGTRRVWKQVIWLTACLVIGTTLWGGGLRLYAAGIQERMRLSFLTMTGVTVDSRNNPVKDYTVVIFPEETAQYTRRGFFPPVNPQGEFRMMGLRPGRYSVVAVETLERAAQQDTELLDRLKALARPVTLVRGDSKAITLTLTHVP
jgi:hypothetical protein